MNKQMFYTSVKLFKIWLIRNALEKNDWNHCKAAKDLGIHRNTIERNMERLGIESKPGKPAKAEPESRVDSLLVLAERRSNGA